VRCRISLLEREENDVIAAAPLAGASAAAPPQPPLINQEFQEAGNSQIADKKLK
jgi:hypothetical protein